MNEDVTFICKRFVDLSKQANRKGVVMFSDFLTMNEQLILQQNKEKLESEYRMSGGYEYAERQMVAFIPDALFYEWDYPMQCVRIRPAYPKFAENSSIPVGSDSPPILIFSNVVPSGLTVTVLSPSTSSALM